MDTRTKINDVFISFCGWGANSRKPTHPTLNLGYPNFEKRVQVILGKKRKTRTSTDGISSQKIYPNRVRMKTFQEPLLKKKEQLEIVDNNNNIFVPKNIVSCDKLGDTIGTIDFEVTTDNQHVDSSIVTYKHMDLLSFFFTALK